MKNIKEKSQWIYLKDTKDNLKLPFFSLYIRINLLMNKKLFQESLSEFITEESLTKLD